MDDAGETRQRPGHPLLSPLLWGAYLACSWTWCIGMFLPALLVKDYGWLGAVVFAVPNILGAAAMGWVIASPDASRRLAQRHEGAMVVFSAVTIAFHVFFLLWVLGMATRISSVPTWGVGVVAGGALVVIALMRLVRGGSDAALGGVSWLVWLISAGVLVMLLAFPAFTPSTERYFPYTANTGGLLWLAPVCVFGFALCPYLDLTFHHARQRTTSGRLAFGGGFLVLFPMMIGLTIVYAGPFIWLLIDDRGVPLAWAPWVGVVILTHIVAQLVFTLIVHQDRIAASSLAARGRTLTIVLAGGAALLGLLHTRIGSVGEYTAGEVVYRCFMAFYGLAFPAYVWLVMIPGRNADAPGVFRRAVRVWAMSIGIAAPMFWMGFIGGQELWLAPGLGVVLLARLLVR
ncbi:MAG: hypothetical protein R3B57_12335 [Phycisphaerales bacterium]